MALSWSGRRQLLYSTVGAVVGIIVLAVLWQTFFTASPTCTDGKQNGAETGVDCGGTCSLVCADSARPPTVIWARALPTSPNTYSAVAYIKNTNAGGAARDVRYSFRLFDENNILVIEHDGVAQLPPIETIPIIDTNIDVGNRIVAHTFFAFSDASAQWVKIPKKDIPTISKSQQILEPNGSRLEATLTNETVNDAKNLDVVAVLFDSEDVARAASKSRISSFPAKSSQKVVFTWAPGNPNIVRAEITVVPSF